MAPARGELHRPTRIPARGSSSSVINGMRTVPIKDTLDRIPGGMMTVPLLLGCAIANAAPGLPKFLGSFSGALFGNPLPILAVFYVCIGATITFETTPYVIRRGGLLLLTKILCGLLCALVLR